MTAPALTTNTLSSRIFLTTMGWPNRIRLPHKVTVSSLSDAEVPAHHVEKRVKCASDANCASTKANTITTSPAILVKASAKHKKFCFSDVQVRHYSRVVGDDPSTEIPLALGWDYSVAETSPVDKHEERQLRNSYINAHYIEPLEIDQRMQKLLAVGLTRAIILREERRRQIQIAQEWQFRIDPSDTTPCTVRHGQILIERYLTV